MKRQPAAPDPDAYVAALDGWRKACVAELRAVVTETGLFDEAIKWGHLVYVSNGPALLIRAEDSRVLFGFWRGRRLRGIDPRLEPGGKYEMARRVFTEGDVIDAAMVRRLALEAHRLNAELGDPTDI